MPRRIDQMASLTRSATSLFVASAAVHIFLLSRQSSRAATAFTIQSANPSTFLGRMTSTAAAVSARRRKVASQSARSNRSKSRSVSPKPTVTISSLLASMPEKAETDPYIWLEEVESAESLAFAEDTNNACLKALGDPTTSETKTYEKVLKVLESNDRIPHVGKLGVDEDGEDVLFNYWKDGTNPKGIWRKTSLSSYRSATPKWTTVLDLDELGKQDDVSWVWKGYRVLPKSRDDPTQSDGKMVNRALLLLSRGGADATVLREFCLKTNQFVTEEMGGFVLPEAKTRVSYKSRNVLYVGSDFGEDSLTDSGYPRTVKEWVRGTKIENAPVVFEGEKTDVSVGAQVIDQRNRGGGIFELRQRSLTFYTSRKWIRKIGPEHLLAYGDPLRLGIPPPPDFIELDIQEDASMDLFSNLLLLSLRSDWTVGGTTYKRGSLISVDYDEFITKGKDSVQYEALFTPTEDGRTALSTYTKTKNFLILSIMDNVKSKLVFMKLDEKNGALVDVGGDASPQIRSSHSAALDAWDSDSFWFTTSGYTQPSSLYLADANRAMIDGEEKEQQTDEFAEPYVTEFLKSLPPQYDADDLQVEQHTAISKDGTEIPYFLIVKKNVKMDGNTPTLLYGYGGFEISLTPKYIATSGLSWLERGGAYVEANIRGGGEFGPAWHQAALKENRNKAYEDFIAVAESLHSSGLCKPSTLGTRGGSNGGLLMGNMLVQAPHMFGAIHCAVPLLDMKRYHILLAGASWMAEYGDPSTDDWKFLEQYSPYHNIDEKASYPPILFTTSTRDDRVHPAHARKMVKRLQDTGEGKWPVYYYENIEGGHGGAADSKQSAFMTALAYDFLWNELSKGRSME